MERALQNVDDGLPQLRRQLVAIDNLSGADITLPL